MKWKNITLRQYDDLQQILTDEGDEMQKLSDITKMFFNIETEKMNLLDLAPYFKQVQELLSSKIQSKIISRQYKIGDNTYCLTKMNSLTLAQFMDFQEVCKNPDNTAQMLSTMLVPKGYDYNDGYDIEDVVEDIYNMNIEDVFAIINFQTGLLKRSYLITLGYLIIQIMKMKKLSWKTKKNLIKQTVAAQNSMDILLGL